MWVDQKLVPVLPIICSTNKRIKTHDNESQGQEEAGLCDKRESYLQVAPL